jgi:hypothetical protein
VVSPERDGSLSWVGDQGKQQSESSGSIAWSFSRMLCLLEVKVPSRSLVEIPGQG